MCRGPLRASSGSAFRSGDTAFPRAGGPGSGPGRAAGTVHVAVIVDRGALRVDSGVQRLDDPLAQRLDLRLAERADRPERVDLRSEERLVGVDVAHSCHALLVEQERLHRLTTPACLLTERLGCEVGTERLHAEP